MFDQIRKKPLSTVSDHNYKIVNRPEIVEHHLFWRAPSSVSQDDDPVVLFLISDPFFQRRTFSF